MNIEKTRTHDRAPEPYHPKNIINVLQSDHPVNLAGISCAHKFIQVGERPRMEMWMRMRMSRRSLIISFSLSVFFFKRTSTLPDGGREFPFSLMLTVSSFRDMQPPMLMTIRYPTRKLYSLSRHNLDSLSALNKSEGKFITPLEFFHIFDRYAIDYRLNVIPTIESEPSLRIVCIYSLK